MKSLEMDRRLIKIIAVHPVAEFKGDQKDHGVSVTFERNFDNSVLNEFGDEMLPTLYKEEDGSAKVDEKGQGGLTIPMPGVKLTARKNLWIPMPMKLRKELENWQIVYHRGASEQSAITANDVKFSDFMLVDASEGGSCLTRFKAYQKLPPEVQGYVDHMAQTEVECTFRAPEKTQADLVDQANKASKKKKKTAAEKIAEEGDPLAGTEFARDAQPADKWPEFPEDAEAEQETE
jgi:hypothetical protein